MNRSWTRPLGLSGGSNQLELPYAGHLPTLGLIKRIRPNAPMQAIMNGMEDDMSEVHAPRNNKPYNPSIKKRNEESAGVNPNNPFSREGNTESLLLAKEREREMKEYTKGDKDGLRVFEKSIATR